MDKVFLERPSVNEVLRDKIRKYKKEHSRLSSNQIARRLGLPPSTFHRLEMGDVKNPGLDICVTVLNGLCSKKETAEFVREYFPEVHESLYGHFQESQTLEAFDESEERYFHDNSTYRMMILATTKAGLSENYVLQEYGRKGHAKFMKLAAKGILTNKNGNFYASKDSGLLSDYTLNKLLTFVHTDMCNEINELGSPVSTLRNTWYASVDLKKVSSEFTQLTDEYIYQIRRIMNKEEYKGNDVVFINNLIRHVK
ncbi:hypothetical protein ACRXCV_01410 [Halobacteriovorax sp. GFR7]|uniref:hypothetical protein n=1 Tax=unclassified Halobacteriovorax TaxID=2639665 RepID=UPI003D999B1F